MKRHALLLLILFASLLPHFSPLAAQDSAETWVDGFSLVIDPSDTLFSNTAILVGHLQRAGERENPQTLYAALEIALHCETIHLGEILPTVHIPLQTVEIPVDYDYLAVSDDLGWAGLDMIVSVYDTISNSYVPLEIHLSLFATFGASEHADAFQRTSLFPTASLRTQDCSLHSVAAPSGNRAHIFSTRSPLGDERP